MYTTQGQPEAGNAVTCDPGVSQAVSAWAVGCARHVPKKSKLHDSDEGAIQVGLLNLKLPGTFLKVGIPLPGARTVINGSMSVLCFRVGQTGREGKRKEMSATMRSLHFPWFLGRGIRRDKCQAELLPPLLERE